MRRLGAVAAVLVLAGCGSGAASFASDDPKGAEACASLADAFKNANRMDRAVSSSFKAGEAATSARTEAIRTAVIDVGGQPAADPHRMHDACVKEGVDMPDVPTP